MLSDREDLWTVKRLAQHLGVSERWIQQECAAGRLPSQQHAGHYRFSDEMVAAIEQGASYWPAAGSATARAPSEPATRTGRRTRIGSSDPNTSVNPGRPPLVSRGKRIA